MVIGLIGGIGSGKSTVTGVMSEHGYKVFRLDDLAKELEKPGNRVYEELTEAFGCGILEEGRMGMPIAKETFASIIYADPETLKKANAIIHPAVWSLAFELTSGAGDYCLETALPGRAFADYCDSVWYVYTDTELRISRLMSGRGYSREKCMSIIGNQIADREFRSFADVVIDNNASEEDLRLKVSDLIRRTGKRAL